MKQNKCLFNIILLQKFKIHKWLLNQISGTKYKYLKNNWVIVVLCIKWYVEYYLIKIFKSC